MLIYKYYLANLKRFPLVFDIETKHTFRQYSDPTKLGISVVGVFDYSNNSFRAFFENELSDLFRLLENAEFLIGYNITGFDIPVLQGSYHGNLLDIPVLDLCDEIKMITGKRYGLSDLTKATLGKGKSGHGLVAIELYKEKRFDELKSYCLDDVSITKELYEFGVNNGYILYPDLSGNSKAVVDWKSGPKKKDKKNEINLGLPF